VAFEIPLLVSAIAFAAFMIFRFRPVVSTAGRASAVALREAKQRIKAATDDASRAIALCDAGDACARLGRTSSAVRFYLRALRIDPTSKEIATRASEGLVRRPAALEKVMWRQLANARFDESHESREAGVIALRALVASYSKRPRFHPRARALENVLEALGEKPSTRASRRPPPPSPE
jgi:tetratricopeptide (TPR) repeat protein